MVPDFPIRWCHCKSACFRSATVAWSYVALVASALVEVLFQYPDISAALGVQQYLPSEDVPYYVFAMMAVTLAARLRSILFKKEDHA